MTRDLMNRRRVRLCRLNHTVRAHMFHAQAAHIRAVRDHHSRRRDHIQALHTQAAALPGAVPPGEVLLQAEARRAITLHPRTLRRRSRRFQSRRFPLRLRRQSRSRKQTRPTARDITSRSGSRHHSASRSTITEEGMIMCIIRSDGRTK